MRHRHRGRFTERLCQPGTDPRGFCRRTNRPTTSTPDLNSLDNHFFRVNPQRGLSHFAVIYNTDNTAYTKTFWAVFAGHYSGLGGQVTDEVRFSSAKEVVRTQFLVTIQDGQFVALAALEPEGE